jgi:hypothetical protein
VTSLTGSCQGVGQAAVKPMPKGVTASLRRASGVETILPVTMVAASLRCSMPVLCTGLLYSQAMPWPKGQYQILCQWLGVVASGLTRLRQPCAAAVLPRRKGLLIAERSAFWRY